MDVKTREDSGGAGGEGMSLPLVILPGLLCDARMFEAQRSAFAAQVIGGFYGDAVRIGDMADYALAQMPPRCALLGHSMGARIAIEVWRRAPGRVARLALASTGTHPVRPGEAEQRYRLRDLGQQQGDAALIDAWLPPMIGPARRNDPALLDILRPMAMDAGTRVYARQIEALLHRPDATAVLPQIDCPTMVIVGRDDAWSPVEQHEAIAATVPGARLRVLERAGHMAPTEDPAGFNAILREWLSMPGPDTKSEQAEEHI